jgi:hypothetical protein
VWFLVNSATSTAGTMLCFVPDTGSFAITTAELALLPAALTQVSVTAYRIKETTVNAGTWTVFVRAADGLASSAAPIGS